ncbi:unnamed protein product [Dracunculus medinensis]|uniref:Anaphase-promoting complex subunit 15 n=1 Tax=Dracunculus medinensis TaxID=318479 RepID=A0A0N4UGF0_DRAME|nr:unnamed protein product [Dracunculus medinensis]
MDTSFLKMAFMYPIHFPSVPLRWDESIWTSILNSEEEEALITNLEARIIARSESYQLRNLPKSVCGQVHEYDDEMEDDDEHDDEDMGELSI